MIVQFVETERAQVEPIPADFAPSFVDDGKTLRWSARVQVGADALQLETGLRYGDAEPYHTRDEALALLREAAWHMQEAARLGWSAKLAPFRHDRHHPTGRTVSVPQWKPPETANGA